MRFLNLAILVLHDVGTIAMQYTHVAGAKGCGMPSGVQPLACCLDPYQFYILMADVGMENSHGIGTAAHRSNNVIGLTAGLHRHLQIGRASCRERVWQYV